MIISNHIYHHHQALKLQFNYQMIYLCVTLNDILFLQTEENIHVSFTMLHLKKFLSENAVRYSLHIKTICVERAYPRTIMQGLH